MYRYWVDDRQRCTCGENGNKEGFLHIDSYARKTALERKEGGGNRCRTIPGSTESAA